MSDNKRPKQKWFVDAMRDAHQDDDTSSLWTGSVLERRSITSTGEANLSGEGIDSRALDYLVAEIDGLLEAERGTATTLSAVFKLALIFLGANLVEKLYLLITIKHGTGFSLLNQVPYTLFLMTHIVVAVAWTLVATLVYMWTQQKSDEHKFRVEAGLASAHGVEGVFPTREQVLSLLNRRIPGKVPPLEKPPDLKDWIKKYSEPVKEYLTKVSLNYDNGLFSMLGFWIVAVIALAVLMAELRLISIWDSLIGMPRVPDHNFLFMSDSAYWIYFVIYAYMCYGCVRLAQVEVTERLLLRQVMAVIGYQPRNTIITDVLQALDELHKKCAEAAPASNILSVLIVVFGIVSSMVVFVLMALEGALSVLQGSPVLILSFLKPVLAGLLCIAILIWFYIDRQNLRSHIKAKLDTFPLFEKLALGNQEVNVIYDWTPWPWSLVFVGPRPRTIKQSMILMAHNLDWFLREPRLLVRFHWLALIAVVAIIAFHIVPLFINVVQQGFTNYVMSTGQLLDFETIYYLAILGLLILQADLRKNISIRLLRDEVRNRLQSSDDGVPVTAE